VLAGARDRSNVTGGILGPRRNEQNVAGSSFSAMKEVMAGVRATPRDERRCAIGMRREFWTATEARRRASG
jgi:hypothetical protein